MFDKFIKIIILTFLTSPLFLAGCTENGTFREMKGDVWTTSYHIKYQSPQSFEDSISDIFINIDRSLSMFNVSSLISRVNRNDTSVRADNMIRDVIAAARIIHKESRGAFDPTIAPLVDIWGFVRINEVKESPTQDEIADALNSVGMKDCYVSSDGRIIKKSPGTMFDFSGIAKGYACDQIAEMFRRQGIKNFMIEIGGEIVSGGVNPDGKPWQILIENPSDDSGVIGNSGVKIIELSDRAIATSGNYRRTLQQNGRSISHVLDPITGYPRLGEILSATVIASDCMTADGLATACMAMSADSAGAMLQRIQGVEGFLVISKSPGDSLKVIAIH